MHIIDKVGHCYFSTLLKASSQGHMITCRGHVITCANPIGPIVQGHMITCANPSDPRRLILHILDPNCIHESLLCKTVNEIPKFCPFVTQLGHY